MKSGFVSIIGRANVGKSTLLNALMKDHIAITSDVAGTTRNVIEGIYNEDDYQIIFVDTPGFTKPINKLGKILNKSASGLTHDVDLILFLVDASISYGGGDKFILQNLKNSNAPVILVLNKIDKISKEKILEKIVEYKDEFDFKEIIPISSLKSENLELLISNIKKYMNDDVKYFDLNTKTNTSIYFRISELVREKILQNTHEEVPHSITCVTTSYEEKKDLIEIAVDIVVDRDSLKKIIIGKGGSFIKAIGSKARLDIEKMLNKKVFLSLYVKTVKDWRNKDSQLKELGFNEFE